MTKSINATRKAEVARATAHISFTSMAHQPDGSSPTATALAPGDGTPGQGKNSPPPKSQPTKRKPGLSRPHATPFSRNNRSRQPCADARHRRYALEYSDDRRIRSDGLSKARSYKGVLLCHR